MMMPKSHIQRKLTELESKFNDEIKQTNGNKKRRFTDVHKDMKPSITYQDFLKVLKEQKDRQEIKETHQKIFKKDIPQMKKKHSFNQLLCHDIYGYSRFIRNLFIAHFDRCEEQTNVVEYWFNLGIQISPFSAYTCLVLLKFQLLFDTCLAGFQKKVQAQKNNVKNDSSQALLQYDEFGLQIFIVRLIVWKYNQYHKLESYAKIQDQNQQFVVENYIHFHSHSAEKPMIKLPPTTHTQDEDFDDKSYTKNQVEEIDKGATCAAAESIKKDIRCFEESGHLQKKDDHEVVTKKSSRNGKEKVAVTGRFLSSKKSASQESVNGLPFVRCTPHTHHVDVGSHDKSIQDIGSVNKKQISSEKQFKATSHLMQQCAPDIESPIELSKFKNSTKKQRAILLNALFDRQVKTSREAEIILTDLERLYQRESSLSGCFGIFNRKSKKEKRLLKQLIPIYKEYVDTKLSIIPEDGQKPCCSFWEQNEIF